MIGLFYCNRLVTVESVEDCAVGRFWHAKHTAGTMRTCRSFIAVGRDVRRVFVYVRRDSDARATSGPRRPRHLSLDTATSSPPPCLWASLRPVHTAATELNLTHHVNDGCTELNWLVLFILPTSARQTYPSLSISDLPVPAPTASSPSVDSPLSPSITPSLFHSRFKTFAPYVLFRPRFDSINFMTGLFLLSIPCNRLSWLTVSFCAHENIVYRIVSYRIIYSFRSVQFISVQWRRYERSLFVHI